MTMTMIMPYRTTTMTMTMTMSYITTTMTLTMIMSYMTATTTGTMTMITSILFQKVQDISIFWHAYLHIPMTI